MERAPVPANAGEIMADVIGRGDLERLTPEQRVAYYRLTCESLGLNPLTKPLDFIRLNGKLVLYATKGATDQLRARHGISIRAVGQEVDSDVLVVTVEGTDATGRTDTDIGAVSVAGLRGEAMANARMKAVTKAKRRLTLSMAGLGMLDESEVETVRDAQPVRVDAETGEIVGDGPEAGAARRPGREPARLTVLDAETRPAAAAEEAPRAASAAAATATREEQQAMHRRIEAAALALGMTPEGLSRRLTEITGKADRSTWGLEDVWKCVEELEAAVDAGAMATDGGEG